MTSPYLPIVYKPQSYTISLRTPIGDEERMRELFLLTVLNLAGQIEGLKKPLKLESDMVE